MKIFYLNSTHWDREWYAPFQHFRYNLVDTLNELIDILESDPEYKLFTLDGQTIVLEDYAEIEPENAEKLRAFIEQGRVVAGPWYVMPDEFLVSGESLIKNLQTGHKVAEKWGGKPLKYGYANDIFGHIAQLPQILKGFGIEGAYIGRGLGNTDYNHFIWRSPDGTECLTSIGFYGAFIVGKLKHYGTEEFPGILKDWVELAMSRSEAPVVFFSNTNDHVMPDRRTPEILGMIREQFPDCEVCDVDLSKMVEELKRHKDKLPTVSGELSEPRDTQEHDARNLTLLYHCLSAHYPLKQQNDRCQNLLESKIEPMLAMSDIEGRPLNHRFVDVAWRWLLQNHPHDSICGCSVDRVHGQMSYRFEQAEDIANRLFEEYCILEKPQSTEGDLTDYIIKLYNTNAQPTDKTHTVEIPFFKKFSEVRQGYALKEGHNNFKLLDELGNELPYQINRIDRDRLLRTSATKQQFENFDIYEISFKTSVPAMGYCALRIVPEKKPVAYPEKMACGGNWAENAFARLEIMPSGRLKVYDKRNGRIYSDLNAFADNGEVGDGWRHQDPMNDFTVSDYGVMADIRVLSNGVAKTVFRIEKHLSVPKNLDRRTLCRSDTNTDLKIVSIVTLECDSAAITVETEIENTACDHRLKALFPTRAAGDSYFAGQAFCKVTRPVGIDPEKALWEEAECVERNMNGIIGKQDTDGNGLAIVSAEGLHEAGVLDDSEATVAVTLYRCFERVFMQPTATMSQLQRKLTFKYKIVPLNGEGYGDLLAIQHSLKGADFTVTERVSSDTAMISAKSYLEIDNTDVALSMFKVADDQNGYIVRMFNASDKPSTAKLNTNLDIKGAVETDLLEQTVTELPIFNGELKLILRPWEIKTVRIF